VFTWSCIVVGFVLLVIVLSGIVFCISCKNLECLNGSTRNAGAAEKEAEKKGLHEEDKEDDDESTRMMVNPSCVVEVD
jgi:hypothetical protein